MKNVDEINNFTIRRYSWENQMLIREHNKNVFDHTLFQSLLLEGKIPKWKTFACNYLDNKNGIHNSDLSISNMRCNNYFSNNILI